MRRADPIAVEVIANALVYASEEMGVAVRNSAYSPNIKERLDHSCALFDARGRLIAQAEHIPVHLGSLPWGLTQMLRVVATEYGGMRAGEMWVANDPYVTGTHLNDVTVVRPIFFDGALVGYAANKAHHTDVGGSVPGSMPVAAPDLFAEGLVVPPMRLVDGDEPIAATFALFAANSRTPEARGGDLRAQTAGNYIGERRLIELCERYGAEFLARAIDRILDESETRMRNALRALGNGRFEAEDFLEDAGGVPSMRIALALTLSDGSVRLDYGGTCAQTNVPLNAVFGVTLSGVHYALRAVTDPTIPMNDGCFRPVEIFVPEGSAAQSAPAGTGLRRQRRDEHAQRRRRAASARARRSRSRSGVERRNDEQRDAGRHALRRAQCGRSTKRSAAAWGRARTPTGSTAFNAT